ncbi:MAG: UDP-N-acetylmuramate dehydrogenase [Candidatus Absconditicoccaceae bacterium]
MNIQKDISLKNYNTFQVDVKAKLFVKIESEEDIYELMKDKIWNENKMFILGGGANILFKGDYDGLVIKNEIIGKEIIKEDEDMVLIKVGAGENWPEWVDRCVEKNLGGIENLALIPGSIGASPIGNIGAYGIEVKDIIYEVEGINLHTGKKEIFKNTECEFGYRDSIFKNKYKDKLIVTYVTWKLKKVDERYKFDINYNDIKRKIDEGNINIANLNVKDIANMISDIRRSKLPDWKKTGTAGSFFKNPVISKNSFQELKSKYDGLMGFDSGDEVKLSAGQLIEIAGFKGIKIGNVGTYQYHALVLINEGGTAQEIVDFAGSIQTKVKEMFGVWLEPEVNYV